MEAGRVRSRNVEGDARSSGTEGLDIISALPQHLMEEILSRLSLRDAVRTSVLSSKWREKWTTLPRLVFDDYCISHVDRMLNPKAIAKYIDTIFALHQGPVEAFELDLSVNRPIPIDSDICRWVHHLSRLSVKELKFHIDLDMIHDLDSCAFACQDLISLDLYNCLFILPSNFTGLKNLRNLVLRPALVDQDMLENLVSNCHQLMKLEIAVSPPDDRFGIKHLKITALSLQHLMVTGWLNTVKIDAPNLQCLDLQCCFLEDINVNTNCLLSLRLVDYEGEGLMHAKADVINRYLLKLFAQQSQLKYVDLDTCFIQYLSLSGFPDTLCNSLLHLKHLVVSINLSSVEDVSATLCLLRSCPNLESIEIWHDDSTEEDTVDDVSKFLQDNSSSCLFKHLKNVWARQITNNQAETSFIKFVMSSSPVLENMVIRPVSTEGGFELTRQLLQCYRPNRARVYYMDPGDPSREPRYNPDYML